MPRVSRSRAEKLSQAWEALGVTSEEVARLPQVSGILRVIGGRAKVLDLLRGSQEPDARKLLDLVDGKDGADLGEAWARLPMEAFCLSAGLPTKRLLELVCGEVFLRSGLEGGLLAAASHPKVVEKSIKMALTSEGLADRRMQLQHAQFLPMPKTQVINMPGGTLDQRTGPQLNVAVAPPPEETVKRLSDRFNAQGSGPELLVASEPDEEEED